jgi:hypothetical protein
VRRKPRGVRPTRHARPPEHRYGKPPSGPGYAVAIPRLASIFSREAVELAAPERTAVQSVIGGLENSASLAWMVPGKFAPLALIHA